MTPIEQFRHAREVLLAHRTDYEAACREFRWPRPGYFNWALDWFDDMARDNTAPALRIRGDDGLDLQLTFDQLRRRSNFLAGHIRSLGVARGTPVLLMLGNVPALWELTLACIKLGCPIIPTTTLLMPADLRDRIDRGGAGVVIADEAFMDRLAGIGRNVLCVAAQSLPAGAADEFVPETTTPATDPLFLYFTSGTTAKPKLVVQSHASYPIGHLSTMYWLGLRPGDRHLNLSSPGWAKHAWSSLFAPWNAGATVVMVNQRRFDAAHLLRELVRCEVTSLCAPPTVWRSIIRLPLEQTKVSLRELASAGEPLNPEVIARVREAWGLTIRDGYGQTETTLQIGNFPGQPVKPGCMGRAAPGYRIELLDADGLPCDEGEICVFMDGGLHRTGDIASRDADGYFTFIGRNDDVFKCSDYKISPFELESLLIEHSAVVEAAVVPSPDAQRLSVPKAFVILAAGVAPSRATAASILAFVRERTSPFKRIRRIEFTDLPKTVSGKIRRVDLRKAELGRDLTEGLRNACEFWEEDL